MNKLTQKRIEILERFIKKFVHKGEDGDDEPEKWEWTIAGAPIEVESFLSSAIDEVLRVVAQGIRDKVIEYVQEAIKNPKSDNYIYAENIPLGRLDEILDQVLQEGIKKE